MTLITVYTFRNSSDIVNPSIYSSKHLKIKPDSRTNPVTTIKMHVIKVNICLL